MRTEVIPYLLRDWFTVTSFLIWVLVFAFLFWLPSSERKRLVFRLPFIYIMFSLIIDLCGVLLRIFQDFNGAVNLFLGNPDKPYFNAWFYNLFEIQGFTTVGMFLIRGYLPLKQKNIAGWIIVGFLSFVLVAQLLKLEPIYLYQSMLYAVGALCILACCFLYYYVLMTEPIYLNKDILRLPSFWQVLCIMFHFSLTFFNGVSLHYLYEKNPELGRAIMEITKFTAVLSLIIILISIAAPYLKWKLEKQPVYD